MTRWPWVLLVPQRSGISEIFEMTPLDQTMLTFETAIAAKAVKQATGCDKINVGALGNQVRQFHLHIIARNRGRSGLAGAGLGPWPGHCLGGGRQPEFTDRLFKPCRTIPCFRFIPNPSPARSYVCFPF
jgi:diadenosine tetraphosphate (Ap4A) HIT family hydrolase